MLPDTLNEPNVPTDVIFVWVGVVSVPITVMKLPTVALTFPETLTIPTVFKLPTLALPLTLNDVSVPVLVMLGCAAAVTLIEVVAVDADPALVA